MLFLLRILVFACGLIAALVAISPNLQEHFNVQNKEIISQGKELTHIPKDLINRTIEITGPADRKMIINALNSNDFVQFST